MAKKFAYVAVVCAIILSALLAFFIPLWAVLIINGGAIVVHRILFRKLQFSAIGGVILYLLVGGLMVSVLVLVMIFPTKIYGEALQNASAEELYKYRKGLGLNCLLFIIIYLIQGILVVIDAVRTKDVILPVHCVVPITLMGGLMIYIMSSVFIWLVYVIGVNMVNILCAVLCEEDGPENWDSGGSGGGGGKSVTIFIIED